MVERSKWYEVDENGNLVKDEKGITKWGSEHIRRDNAIKEYLKKNRTDLLKWADDNGLYSEDEDFLLREVLSRILSTKAIEQHYSKIQVGVNGMIPYSSVLKEGDIKMPEMKCHYDINVKGIPFESKFKSSDFDQWGEEFVSFKKGEYLSTEKKAIIVIPHWGGVVSAYRLCDSKPPKDGWNHSASTAAKSNNNVEEQALVFKRSDALWTEIIPMPFK